MAFRQRTSSEFIRKLNHVNAVLQVQRHLKLSAWEILISQSVVINVEEAKEGALARCAWNGLNRDTIIKQ